MSSNKKKFLGFFPCGCRDSESVAVSARIQRPNSSSDLVSVSTNKASISTCWEDRDRDFSSLSASATVTDLLRELDQVENAVSSIRPISSSQQLQVFEVKGKRLGRTRRRRTTVAVEKDSDDPVSDFQRSMAQMILEHEIMEVEELKELVRKYLALNSPEQHP